LSWEYGKGDSEDEEKHKGASVAELVKARDLKSSRTEFRFFPEVIICQQLTENSGN
jgi:hypothetical protein